MKSPKYKDDNWIIASKKHNNQHTIDDEEAFNCEWFTKFEPDEDNSVEKVKIFVEQMKKFMTRPIVISQAKKMLASDEKYNSNSFISLETKAEQYIRKVFHDLYCTIVQTNTVAKCLNIEADLLSSGTDFF